MSDRSDPQWPFAGNVYETPRGPIQTYTCAASDRIEAVRRMTDREQLAAALDVPRLQKSVAAVIRWRIKQLDTK